MTPIRFALPLLLVLTAAVAKPPVYKWHCAKVEEVFAATRAPATEKTALYILEKIALGRATTVDAQSQRDLQLPPEALQNAGFLSIPVRELAIKRLGETGTPEAFRFLSEFKREDVGPNDSGLRIWPAIKVAILANQYAGIADLKERREFLENIIGADDHSDTSSVVKGWAVDQICDGGFKESTVVAARWLRYALSGQDGELEVAYCEARIRIVSSNVDRTRALGSALRTDGTASQRLIRWAWNQLEWIDTPAAFAELKRFEEEIDKLPPDRLPSFDFMRPELREVLMNDKKWKR
jgi:hypothetical protein